LGSSKTLEAGVDTRLEEGEVGILDRGVSKEEEEEEEAGSLDSGRYGLCWVSMGVMQTKTGMNEGWYVPVRRAFVLGEKAYIRN
jgi:hypothetical protein